MRGVVLGEAPAGPRVAGPRTISRAREPGGGGVGVWLGLCGEGRAGRWGILVGLEPGRAGAGVVQGLAGEGTREPPVALVHLLISLLFALWLGVFF